MSQILLRRLSAHSLGARSHGCRRLSSAVYGGGGERRRPSAQAPQEEESRAVRVAVWWDFENCNIPNGVNVCRLAPRVAAAVRAAGIRGPLSITAFGDVLQLARSSQEALAATGVSISHVPRSGKNSSDRSFMADLVYWIAQNPPPVHFFLISGDTDFANLLHRLRMSNYNVLLACPSYATSVLCSASTFMWQWDALVKGEDFSPKHFNHPPDGLHGSWYGYYKGALDDPFLEKESREPIKVPSDSQLCSVPSDTKHCSIPNYVTNAIVEALRLNPKGMRLSLLREELTRNNVYMGTDFFGHKKFTCLLQSMPDIVELIDSPPGENQQYAILANKRLQSGDGSSKTLSSAQRNVRENNFTQGAQNDKYPSLMSTPEAKPQSPSESVDRSRSLTETVSENPPTFSDSSSPLVVLSEDQKEHKTANESAQTESPAKHMEVDEKAIPGTPSSSGLENAVNKDGLLKRIWVLWNGPENAESKVSQNCESTSTELVDDLRIPLQKHSADHRVKLPISSDGEDSENMKRDPSLLENLEPCSRPASVSRSKAGEKDSSEKNEGLFTWASRWWTSGKSDAGNSTTKNVVDETTDSNEEFESSNASAGGRGQQLVNEIFAKAHLWDVLEQQLSKPLGSEFVSKAKTREELARGLQKLGCWPLKGLTEKDLHHLVHLLISEQKWIEETSSRLFPFRLTLPHKRTCVPSNSSKSGVLSSIFVKGKPQKGKYADDNSRRNKLLTREEILSDCHKLLKELLSQHKYGFNISIFKRIFAQKHGYELDHQMLGKLGYPDLASLLQIMPDARIKFPRVLPMESGNGQAGSKGTGNQNNGDDLIWEELGPVSATTGTSASEVDEEMCYRPPTPSDDEFSDNDNQAGQQPRTHAEHSSLLQIIDSWNSSKDDGSSKKSQDIDGLVDCSKSNLGSLDNLTAENLQRPTRPLQKQYSFVSDSEEGKEKDKLVESVLGSLQKARSSKLRN
ncbi:hypothetical protein HU200_059681 [Digitaria exilis]|uniref:HTH OST-type domain-containing protein n=1 Tax=Digitaria exilis TaxID=1010633 RepID=A0A835DZJ4_9POAL|nr:hypothetical protein HU200_059681 [Digitaria exilis]CAB3459462.1 unnamed protein product [Digitaria exilis]